MSKDDWTGYVGLPLIDQNGKCVGMQRTSLASHFQVEVHVDDNGTTWTPPTAWAYFAACRALEAEKQKVEALTASASRLFDENAALQRKLKGA